MGKGYFNWIVPIFLLSLPLIVEAHPVTYKGGYSFNFYNQPAMRDWSFQYSYSAKNSVAIRYLDFDQKNERKLYLGQFSWLAKRWYGDDFQGNLYFSFGLGNDQKMKVNNSTKRSAAGLAAVEADWESRKIYFSGKAQVVGGGNFESIEYFRLRAGFAPYVAEFESLHTWFIMQLENLHPAEHPVTLTPLLRFFYKNVLWEVGASSRGDYLLNFMVHF